MRGDFDDARAQFARAKDLQRQRLPQSDPGLALTWPGSNRGHRCRCRSLGARRLGPRVVEVAAPAGSLGPREAMLTLESSNLPVGAPPARGTARTEGRPCRSTLRCQRTLVPRLRTCSLMSAMSSHPATG